MPIESRHAHRGPPRQRCRIRNTIRKTDGSRERVVGTVEVATVEVWKSEHTKLSVVCRVEVGTVEDVHVRVNLARVPAPERELFKILQHF